MTPVCIWFRCKLLVKAERASLGSLFPLTHTAKCVPLLALYSVQLDGVGRTACSYLPAPPYHNQTGAAKRKITVRY